MPTLNPSWALNVMCLMKTSPSFSWVDLTYKKLCSVIIILWVSPIKKKICGNVFSLVILSVMGFPGGASGKEPAGSIPGSGRSPGVRNGYPLQYSCLGNPIDRGAWWITVYGVAKSQIRLNTILSILSVNIISSILPKMFPLWPFLE